MFAELDHLLWAAPDLQAGTDTFDALTGVRPVMGGSHPGFGTRNSLLSLSPTTYLEVIAPDPDQDLNGTMGGELAALTAPKLWLFALSTRELGRVAEAARSVGLTVADPVEMSRTKPDGVRLDWSIMPLADDRWPGKLPFFIDWQGSLHPANTTPGGVTLDAFMTIDPNPDALREVYAAIGCKVPVHGGVSPGFVAHLNTPKGSVVLT
ncbi:MAG: VOC family protein [Pseudomonadota bacterium]